MVPAAALENETTPNLSFLDYTQSQISLLTMNPQPSNIHLFSAVIVAETADIHPPSCYVHGSGVYSCVAGVESEFHVQCKDRSAPNLQTLHLLFLTLHVNHVHHRHHLYSLPAKP